MDVHGGTLDGYLLGLTKNPQDAADLSQQLWICVFEKFDHFPLLYTTAKNLFIDEWRKKKTRSFVVAMEEQPEFLMRPAVAENATPEEEQALWNRFWENFPGVNLSNEQKSVFWLC